MRRAKDDGTILLTTLLIMAVMAGVAIAVMDDIRFAVKRTINVQSYAQADWLVRDTEAAAVSFAAQLQRLPPPARNLFLLQNEPVLLPIEGGTIMLQFFDASNCFALNSVVSKAGRADANTRRQFENLAEVLGLDPRRAARVSATLTDWIDADDQALPNGAEDGDYLRKTPAHRTANTALHSPEDLRSLMDMREEIFQTLRPHVCVGEIGEAGRFNLNTAQLTDAPVLSALLGGVSESETALRLIRERPLAGYSATAQLSELPAFGGTLPKDIARNQIGFTPKVLGVEAEITIGPAKRFVLLHFAGLDTGDLRLTYRARGSDARRPVPDVKPEATP